MESAETESKLLVDAASGDPAAVEALLRLHYPLLLTYARRHTPAELRSEIDPADIIQDVAFEAIRRVRELRILEARSFRAWLFTIARNRIGQLLRMHRSLKRGGGRLIGEDDPGSGEATVVHLLQDLALYERTPSQSALAHEAVERLEEAMMELDDDQRQVLRMRYMECLDVSEVATALNRSEGAVRNLCMRALKALRVKLISSSRLA